MKKIAIDFRKISDNVGISTYLKSILYSIKKLKDKEICFILLVNNKNFDFTEYTSKNIKIEIIKSTPFSLRENFEIPAWLRKNKIDIYHSTHFNVPLLMFLVSSCKIITTIHDLIPFKSPNLFKGLMKKVYFKFIFRYAVFISRQILTVSMHSKNEIIKFLKVPENKINVIYNYISSATLTSKADKNDKLRNILFAGALYEHKNIISLIRAIKILVESGFKDIKLTLIGRQPPYFKVLDKEIKSLNIEEYVDCRGCVPDDELTDAYKNADLFVFPSLEEGFGIPVIEAMSYGIPVISSNKSVLPEIVGDAGVLIEPTPEEIAKAIKFVLLNQNIYNEFVKKGLERVKIFSIDNFSAKLINNYKDLLKK